jgi:hypothetical protein
MVGYGRGGGRGGKGEDGLAAAVAIEETAAWERLGLGRD